MVRNYLKIPPLWVSDGGNLLVSDSPGRPKNLSK